MLTQILTTFFDPNQVGSKSGGIATKVLGSDRAQNVFQNLRNNTIFHKHPVYSLRTRARELVYREQLIEIEQELEQELEGWCKNGYDTGYFIFFLAPKSRNKLLIYIFFLFS